MKLNLRIAGSSLAASLTTPGYLKHLQNQTFIKIRSILYKFMVLIICRDYKSFTRNHSPHNQEKLIKHQEAALNLEKFLVNVNMVNVKVILS